MRNAALIVALTAGLLVAGGGVGVYAYDQSRSDTIAEGVRISGVAVGGMTVAQARERVEGRLLAPLDEPLVVSARGEEYELTAREARIRADVAGTVAEALEVGRDEGIISRTWRNLTGGEVDEDIELEIDYSRAAVSRLVDKIRVASDEKPREAEIEFSTTSLAVTESKKGVATNTDSLRSDIKAALVDPTGDREVEATFRRTEPEVTTSELKDKYPVVITVDRSNFRLRLFKDLEVAKTYPIALGKAGLETPAGLYNIQNKAVDPAWHVPNSDWAGDLAGKVIPGGTAENPLKARWLGIYNGVGIHGTSARNSIGTNASHGCIRMLVEDVKALYDEVPVGAPVFIS